MVLSKTPNPIISSTFTKTVLVSNYYFRIRCEAAAALVTVGPSHARAPSYRLINCLSLVRKPEIRMAGAVPPVQALPPVLLRARGSKNRSIQSYIRPPTKRLQ